MKYFDVCDPRGFTHRVGIDSAGAHGTENLGHHLGERSARLKLIREIVNALVFGAPPPPGFTVTEVTP